MTTQAHSAFVAVERKLFSLPFCSEQPDGYGSLTHDDESLDHDQVNAMANRSEVFSTKQSGEPWPADGHGRGATVGHQDPVARSQAAATNQLDRRTRFRTLHAQLDQPGSLAINLPSPSVQMDQGVELAATCGRKTVDVISLFIQAERSQG
jgi:hypothetical protein